MASNFQQDIDKLMNRLEDDETDINKITNVTHNILMTMSIREGLDAINHKKKRNGENLGEEEEIKLMCELIQKIYVGKLEFIKKSLLNLCCSLCYSFLALTKKVALSNNKILNLTDLYINEYKLEKEKHFQNLKQIFINHGNKPCYIFRYISFVKNFLILSKSGITEGTYIFVKTSKKLLHSSKKKKSGKRTDKQ